MADWTPDEHDRVGSAEELQIASVRRDGTLSSWRTIWVVPAGDDICVRSVNGPGSAWFKGTRARHEGRIRAGGVEKDVTLVDLGDERDDEIDAAYRRKYGHYAAYIIDAITSEQAASTTMQLAPRPTRRD
ncbi:DUF2255 family protein [Streptomyces sp. AcE210]|uniref:DUF2255 family protein n=1 Tax=Streptomyces sp. AcE210 TaxID=2292703 RepID=UPI000E30820F|nr:DUF2255 family protein [Streptomyces sp. AcE210]RFC77526.1 DUF2255 family protein [Streptomyces sp. AcE210]